MKNFTHALLVAGMMSLTVPASAQLASQLAPRTTVAAKAKAAFTLGMAKAAATATPAKAITINPADYGEHVTIVKEDFSKMTTGTEEKPDEKTDINYANDDNAWINMSGDYTDTFGWGSHEAFPAGGCLWIDGGQVNTPMLDLSGNDGIFFVKFRARTNDPDLVAEHAIIEAAETRNMGPTWDMLGNYNIEAITNEWKEYEYMFYGGGKTTLINICPNDVAILIDDIEVYQVKQYVGTPVAHKHRYYTGSSFNLSWDKVEGADKYILNVYTVKGDGVTPNDYLAENQEVSGTEFVVDNADSGDTYYYTVKAVKGTHESMPCDPVKIYDVETPKLNETSVVDGKYTASWNETPMAERYNYMAAAKQVAKKDGKFEVSHLYMPGSKWPEGLDAEVKNTRFETDNLTSDQGYPQLCGQAGWRATHYAVYKDALTLDGFFYYYQGSDAGLTSPEFDLSKDGGKAKLELTLSAEPFNYTDADNNNLTAYSHCCVALFNYSHDNDDYVQDELVRIENLDEEWQDYTVNLTKGTEHSIIGVYATYAPTSLFVQRLVLSQNCKAGDYYYDPFYYGSFIDGTSVDITVPYRDNGLDIYHKVQSVRVKKAAQSEYESTEFQESKMSDYQLVTENVVAGIADANVSLSGATVRLEGDQIVVNNPEQAPVYMYNAAGATVASDLSGAATVRFGTPANGTYIVKAGKHSVKVTL